MAYRTDTPKNFDIHSRNERLHDKFVSEGYFVERIKDGEHTIALAVSGSFIPGEFHFTGPAQG